MTYNGYANMSTKQKESLIEGSGLQQEVMEYYNMKHNTEEVRTPKRQRSGEHGSAINSGPVVLSGDDDDNDFQTVSHQRKEIQREHNEHRRKNDLHTPDEPNIIHQSQNMPNRKKNNYVTHICKW